MHRPAVLACAAAIALVGTAAAADQRYFGLEVPRRPEVFEPVVIAAIRPLAATNPAFSGDFRRFVFTAVDASTPAKVATPVALPGDFNSAADEWDVIEHPHGKLRLWVSGRPGGAGRTDIYFARKNERGEWSPAQSLAAVNTALLETAPRLSPDGRVLFFQRVEDQRERLYWVDLGKIVYGRYTEVEP
jgi:WD40-like Beta Propeller Repeat